MNSIPVPEIGDDQTRACGYWFLKRCVAETTSLLDGQASINKFRTRPQTDMTAMAFDLCLKSGPLTGTAAQLSA